MAERPPVARDGADKDREARFFSFLFTRAPFMGREAMRYLFPVLIVVFIITSALIFFFGDSGLAAYSSLDRYREKLAANVDDLRQRNSDLAADLASLRNNPERTVVLARSIGLYRSGDQVVKLEGRSSRAEPTAIGSLLKLRKTHDARNSIFKSTAICASVVLLAFAGISLRRSRRRAHDGQRG